MKLRGFVDASNSPSTNKKMICNLNRIDLEISFVTGDPLESEDITYPCVVKASKGEDTKAVRLVKDSKVLNAAIEHALSYSDHVIIER